MEVSAKVVRRIMKTEKKILINSLKQYIEWYGLRCRENDDLLSMDKQDEKVKLSIELLNKLDN